MPTATLRRVGGSVMVAVPPDYLARTGLGPDEVATWEIDGNQLVIARRRHGRTTRSRNYWRSAIGPSLVRGEIGSGPQACRSDAS